MNAVPVTLFCGSERDILFINSNVFERANNADVKTAFATNSSACSCKVTATCLSPSQICWSGKPPCKTVWTTPSKISPPALTTSFATCDSYSDFAPYSISDNSSNSPLVGEQLGLISAAIRMSSATESLISLTLSWSIGGKWRSTDGL